MILQNSDQRLIQGAVAGRVQRSVQLAHFVGFERSTCLCANSQRAIFSDDIYQLNGQLVVPVSQILQKDYSRPLQLLQGIFGFNKYVSLASKKNMPVIYEELLQSGFCLQEKQRVNG